MTDNNIGQKEEPAGKYIFPISGTIGQSVGETITICDGLINPSSGRCEKCYQPAQTTSNSCGRVSSGQPKGGHKIHSFNEPGSGHSYTEGMSMKEEGMEHKPPHDELEKVHESLGHTTRNTVDHVWTTYVLPLQSEVKRLRELNAGILSNLKTADKCGNEVMSELKELESEVKIKDARIKELEYRLESAQKMIHGMEKELDILYKEKPL